MVKRGGFVEDKLSPLPKTTLERLGLRKGHSHFGCYVLDNHTGFFLTGHCDGGAYVAKAKTGEQKQLYSKDSPSKEISDEISGGDNGWRLWIGTSAKTTTVTDPRGSSDYPGLLKPIWPLR